MTVDDIMTRAQVYSGQPMSLRLALTLINDCMNVLCNLYDTACQTDEVVCTITSKPYEYELDEDVLVVKNVYHDNKKTHYKIRNDKIIFNDQGTYNILLLRTPDEVETQYDEPEINRAYDKCIVQYLVAHTTRPPSKDVLDEFYQMASVVHFRLKQKKKSNRRMPAPIWR